MRDLIGIVALATAIGGQAQAAIVDLDEITYGVYRLDVPKDLSLDPFGRATAVNSNGRVVGYYRTRDMGNTVARGFTADPLADGSYGPTTRIPDGNINLNRAFVWDVNASGTVVGSARRLSGDPLYAFVKRPSDPSIPAQPIAGLSGRYSEANGVNAGNAVVGYACPGVADCNAGSGANRPTAFYFDPTSQAQPVVGLPNLTASASRANAINDSGLIAGAFATSQEYRALRYNWSTQQAEDLHPYFDNAVSSEALAINSSGDVAGRVGRTRNDGGSGGGNTVQEAFVLEHGSTTPTALTLAGYQGSAALAIADNGWVVGTACLSGKDCGRFEDTGTSAKAEDNTAVLWVPGLDAIDLSSLPGLSAAGWTKLSFAESIVDMGEFVVIAGVGYFGATLQRQAFVLRIDESSVPIPEPRTYAMLAAGLLVLGAVRVRRAQRMSQ